MFNKWTDQKLNYPFTEDTLSILKPNRLVNPRIWKYHGLKIPKAFDLEESTQEILEVRKMVSEGIFPKEFMANFAIMFIFIIIASLMSLGLMIYYIIHANNNPKNDSNKKLMWTLVLIFASSIASIVYYFVEIMPIKTEEKTLVWNKNLNIIIIHKQFFYFNIYLT